MDLGQPQCLRQLVPAGAQADGDTLRDIAYGASGGGLVDDLLQPRGVGGLHADRAAAAAARADPGERVERHPAVVQTSKAPLSQLITASGQAHCRGPSGGWGVRRYRPG